MTEEKIARINELSRLSRLRTLTDLEQCERATLRREYVDSFKRNLEEQLKNIQIVDPQ